MAACINMEQRKVWKLKLRNPNSAPGVNMCYEEGATASKESAASKTNEYNMAQICGMLSKIWVLRYYYYGTTLQNWKKYDDLCSQWTLNYPPSFFTTEVEEWVSRLEDEQASKKSYSPSHKIRHTVTDRQTGNLWR